MAGLYIHIPFCESRCIYCGFYSTTSLQLRDDYVAALCREMELRPREKALGCNEPIQTIYLGGGTPSMLSGRQLEKIFQSVQKNYVSDFSGMEITMECNPDDVTEDFCQTIAMLPVNRISMGAQTFSEDRLHFLRRRHHAEDVCLAVQRLRSAGIQNISIDLMFGFPGETLEDWENDILEALHLQVEHISAYSLMYEEGTPLYRLLENGKIDEIDEELSLQMYETLCNKLKEAGYEHYEISNFALPGYRSRHNSSYWNEVPYIGIGAAAHSYKRSPKEISRSWNVENLQGYISSVSEGKRPSECEILDITTRYNDLITTALRTKDGINLLRMKKEFGDTFVRRLQTEAQDKIKRGLMEFSDGRLHLTKAGIFISDDIMGDFMIVE